MEAQATSTRFTTTLSLFDVRKLKNKFYGMYMVAAKPLILTQDGNKNKFK